MPSSRNCFTSNKIGNDALQSLGCLLCLFIFVQTFIIGKFLKRFASVLQVNVDVFKLNILRNIELCWRFTFYILINKFFFMSGFTKINYFFLVWQLQSTFSRQFNLQFSRNFNYQFICQFTNIVVNIRFLKIMSKLFYGNLLNWPLMNSLYGNESLDQWFLTWVGSNPRGSVRTFHGFDRGQDSHKLFSNVSDFQL